MNNEQQHKVHPLSPFGGRGARGRGINRYATAAISRKKKGLTEKRNDGGCVMVFINTEHGQKNMDKKTNLNAETQRRGEKKAP
jgi:replicative superfamily II helicase